MGARTNGDTNGTAARHRAVVRFPVIDRVGTPCDLEIRSNPGYVEQEATNGDWFAISVDQRAGYLADLVAAFDRAERSAS